MAKRTAKKRAADDASSRTSEGPGTTTLLRSLLTVGNRTSPSQTQWSSRRSLSSNDDTESGSSNTSSGVPTTLISIRLPTGDLVEMEADEVTIEIDRDFIDATTRYSPEKLYIAGRRTFTIKGRLGT